MAITVDEVAAVDETDASFQLFTATIVSGGWWLGAALDGAALIRHHIATGATITTNPWQAGSQNLYSCAVRPNGNVCFFRNDTAGTVHEVVPSTGATTTWTAGGPLGHGGYLPVAVVGETAFFTGWVTGGVACTLHLGTRTRAPLGATGGTYQRSIVCPTGTAVWLFGASEKPIRVDLATSAMTTPTTAPMAAQGVPVAEWAAGGVLWVPRGGTLPQWRLDPANPAGFAAASNNLITGHELGGQATTLTGWNAQLRDTPDGSAIESVSLGIGSSPTQAAPVWGENSWWVTHRAGGHRRLVRAHYTPPPAGGGSTRGCRWAEPRGPVTG